MFSFLLNFLRSLIVNLLHFLRIRKEIDSDSDSTPKKTQNMYSITVNYNIKKLNGNLKVCLNTDSSINDCKKIIVNELNKIIIKKLNDESDKLKPNQIAVIFQGQELDNETRIANYDLGQNSILNVVKITEKSISSKQADLFECALLLSTNLEPSSETNLEPNLTKFSKDEENDFVLINKDGTEQKKQQSNLIKLNEDKKSYFFVYCSARSCRKITTGKLRVKCAKCNNHSLIVEQRPKDWSDVLNENRIMGKCQNYNCKGLFAKFYFKCSSNEHRNDGDNRSNFNEPDQTNQQNQDDKALPIESIKYNTRLIKCPICNDIKERVFLFKCEHLVCLDCFLMYCESKLNSRDLTLVDEIGYTVNCVFDCINSYIENTHCFHILSNRDYERYQAFATEEYVLKNGGVICPQPKCSQAMLIDKNNCTEISCISCNFLFCLLCKQDYHEGQCSLNFYLENPKDELQSRSFGQLIKDKIYSFTWSKNVQQSNDEIIKIKRCPNPSCNCPTERYTGCLHITCKICSLDWCWLCESEWGLNCMSSHWFE